MIPATQIPFIDHDRRVLWCACDTAIPLNAPLSACPACGRATADLHMEAAYNAEVMRFIETKPMGWGLPGSDTKVEWWQRMTAAYETERATRTEEECS